MIDELQTQFWSDAFFLADARRETVAYVIADDGCTDPTNAVAAFELHGGQFALLENQKWIRRRTLEELVCWDMSPTSRESLNLHVEFEVFTK